MRRARQSKHLIRTGRQDWSRLRRVAPPNVAEKLDGRAAVRFKCERDSVGLAHVQAAQPPGISLPSFQRARRTRCNCLRNDGAGPGTLHAIESLIPGACPAGEVTSLEAPIVNEIAAARACWRSPVSKLPFITSACAGTAAATAKPAATAKVAMRRKARFAGVLLNVVIVASKCCSVAGSGCCAQYASAA